jgi:hypothetical protein
MQPRHTIVTARFLPAVEMPMKAIIIVLVAGVVLSFGIGLLVGWSTAECCQTLAQTCEFADDLMDVAQVTCLACPGLSSCEALQLDKRGPELCGNKWGSED